MGNTGGVVGCTSEVYWGFTKGYTRGLYWGVPVGV